jgi:hypothetical protein
MVKHLYKTPIPSTRKETMDSQVKPNPQNNLTMAETTISWLIYDILYVLCTVFKSTVSADSLCSNIALDLS